MGGKSKSKLKEKSPKRNQQEQTLGQDSDFDDEELRLNRLDRTKLEYCKYRGCLQKSFGPHKHNLKECEDHQFCKMEKGSEIINFSVGITTPGMVGQALFGSKHLLDSNSTKIQKARFDQKLGDLQKIAASQYSLDHWVAQGWGLDIDNLPQVRPTGMEKPDWDRLKKRYKNNTSAQGNKKGIVQEDGQREDGERQAQKPQGGGGRSQVAQAPKEFDQLKPFIYPKHKRIVTIIDEYDEQRRRNPKLNDPASQIFQEKQLNAQTQNQAKSPDGENQGRHKRSRTLANEKEAHSRFHSPYINDFLERKEVSQCVSKIQEYKHRLQLKREDFEYSKQQAKQERNEKPSGSEQQTSTVGRAKFVNLKKRASSGQAALVSENANASPSLDKKNAVLSTFQKLQNLRRIVKEKQALKSPEKRPLHNLMMEAALKKPQNHFVDVRQQKIADFWYTTQAGSPQALDSIINPFLPADDENLSRQESIMEKKQGLEDPIPAVETTPKDPQAAMQYLSQPLMRDRLENFIHEYKNNFREPEVSHTTQAATGGWNTSQDFRASRSQASAQARTAFALPSRASGDYGNLDGFDAHAATAHPLRFRQIDAANEKRATEYNSSILSPSINTKKDSLMRSLKIWPLQHSITRQKQNAALRASKGWAEPEAAAPAEEELTSLEKEIKSVKARMAQPPPDPRIAEMQRTKRLQELAKKPKIRIDGAGVDAQGAEGAGDTQLRNILNRIHLAGETTKDQASEGSRALPEPSTTLSPKVTGQRTLGSAYEEAMPRSSLGTQQGNRFFAEPGSGAFSPVALSSLAMSVKDRKSLLVSNRREGPLGLLDSQFAQGSAARGASHRTGRFGHSWRNKNRSGSFLNQMPREVAGSLHVSIKGAARSPFPVEPQFLPSAARSEKMQPNEESRRRAGPAAGPSLGSPHEIGGATRVNKTMFVNVEDQDTARLDALGRAGLANTQPPVPAVERLVPGSPKKSLANSVKVPAIGEKKRAVETQGLSLQAVVTVKATDIEQELREPAISELDSSNLAVNVILDLQTPDPSQIGKNVFECAEYWLSKGYQAQTGRSVFQALQGASKGQAVVIGRGQDQTDQALDFYFQGLRKNPRHYGCCHNIGVTFLLQGKNCNARKWFRFAKSIEPEKKAPYLGEAITSLKLGEIKACLKLLQARPGQRQLHDKKRTGHLGTVGSADDSIQAFPAGTDGTEPDGKSLERTQVIVEERNGGSEEMDALKADPEKGSDGGKKDTEEGREKSSEKGAVIQLIKLDIENQFTFLEAICYKKAQDFERSQREYGKLEKIFQSRQGVRLAKTAFTNLMLPLQINRKVVEDNVQQFLDCVSITDADAYWDEQLLEPLTALLHFKHRTWLPEKLEKAVRFIKHQPLFRRLVKAGCTNQELRALIPQLTVVEKKAGDIIFDNNKDLHIVLNGRVVLRYHEEDPLEYQYIAQYTPGHVIGHDTLDGGMSKMGQVFPFVASKECILLAVKKDVFERSIWRRTQTQAYEIKLRALQQLRIMESLSDQTLYDILYEHGSIRLFRPGHLVLACHPRSPLNADGRKLYDEEYCTHMRQEANLSIAAAGGGDENETRGGASALGNFFAMVNHKKDLRAQQGISEEHYLSLRQRHKVEKEGNPPESSQRSLILILEGSCRVVHRVKGQKDFEVFDLRPGDHFGASDCLRLPGIEYLGDILAGPRGLKCMVIQKPDQVLQLWERKNLQGKLRKELDTLKIMVENKYAFDQGVFQRY